MKSKWAPLASSVAAATTLLASAAAWAGPRFLERGSMGRPIDLSVDGHRSDWLFDVTTTCITILFIIMVTTIAIAVMRHREGKAQASYDHGNARKNLILTACIAGTIFFGVDGTLLVHSFGDLKEAFWAYPEAKDDPVEIEVMAQQWAWNIRYPGPDKKFNTADDIITLNDIHIPVGKPVMLKMQSKDVIHSFYLPNFRVKQDVVPGTTTRMWFQATQPGTVEIGCAQHCGTNHYKMRGFMTVESDADYQTWYSRAVADAQRRFDPEDGEAHWGWDWEAN